MKKYFAIAATFLMAVLVTAQVSYAQGKTVPAQLNLLTPESGVNFVDEDGDGVCDNEPVGDGEGFGKGNRGAEKQEFVDEDGDGVCDNEPIGEGPGNRGAVRPNFIDEDGDGICDNEGTGLGEGKGNRGTVKPNFVDLDGDGVCDNYIDGGERAQQLLGDGSGATGGMNGRKGRK